MDVHVVKNSWERRQGFSNVVGEETVPWTATVTTPHHGTRGDEGPKIEYYGKRCLHGKKVSSSQTSFPRR